jgi:hypothetical protein
VSKTGFNRRQFMEKASTLTAGAVVGVSTIATLPKRSVAETSKIFSPHEAETLVSVCRGTYPQDKLGSAPYVFCVEGLEKKAAEDESLKKRLSDGVVELDALSGGRFLDLDENRQAKILEGLASSEFFQAIRAFMVVALYNNKKIWPTFGYEGASFPYGGYIDRGFDDIDWLS